MSIGYACINLSIPGVKMATCTLKNATSDALLNLIKSNIEALDLILDYNLQNGIKLFRISSDVIPFGSHPVNTLNWWDIFSDKLQKIGYKALSNGMRLSMHPGQYTVLNSPNPVVVMRAIDDLKYHTKVLDAMGLSQQHKIVLHIGGVYGEKDAAMNRFMQQYRRLDQNIKKRLVIENDDDRFTISDALSIGINEGIPVVFDTLHHQVNPDHSLKDLEWVHACASTWKPDDGKQKIHYSQQNVGKKPGSHSDTIEASEFLTFYNRLHNQDLDIMLEVKDKNLSAIKCIRAIASSKIQ